MSNQCRCPVCKIELLSYTAKVYPYESGLQCSKCLCTWSDLQISKGELIDDFIAKNIIKLPNKIINERK